MAYFYSTHMEHKMVTEEAEQVIDDLIEKKDPEATKAAARKRMSEELAASKPAVDVETLSKPSATVWTLEAMRKREPVQADLYDDGTFMFLFHPDVLTSEFAQSRFDRANKYFQDREAKRPTVYRFANVMSDYVDICARAIASWPAQEHLRDEDGNLQYTEDGDPVTRPLPPSRENISLLPYEQVVALLDAMNKTISGEANGQPS